MWPELTTNPVHVTRLWLRLREGWCIVCGNTAKDLKITVFMLHWTGLDACSIQMWLKRHQEIEDERCFIMSLPGSPSLKILESVMQLMEPHSVSSLLLISLRISIYNLSVNICLSVQWQLCSPTFYLSAGISVVIVEDSFKLLIYCSLLLSRQLFCLNLSTTSVLECAIKHSFSDLLYCVAHGTQITNKLFLAVNLT